MGSSAGIGSHSFAVNVFRYPDAQRYIGALGQPGAASAAKAAAALSKVTTFTTQLRMLGTGPYLLFPETLSPGYYAASVTDASSGSGPILVRFQVTDISFYVSVTQTQTLVWLNNLASGGPVRDAKLRVGGVDVVTGPDGIAVFPTQTIRQRRGVETVAKTADGREAVISVSAGPGDTAGLKNRPEVYWRYLYADRPVYRPSDTISFWGIALPREKAADAVQRITLSLS